LTYSKYGESSKFQTPSSKGWYAWTLGLFVLSLMAKPMLVTLPFVMLLLDVWPLGRIQILRIGPASAEPPTRNTHNATRSILPLLVEKIPFVALTIASCVVTFLAQRTEAMVSL